MSDPLMSFLRQMGLEALHGVFVENDVDAELARTLTDADLRELGLSLGQRKRFIRAIALASPTEGLREESVRFVPERRQLTVLFCDLVGSTRLATEMDPEDLKDVIQAYHSACGSVMRGHEGHVAYHQGDGLMVYFGFPVAREDDAERAIRAGLEVREAVAGIDTPLAEPLRVRVGIATGLVVVGDLAGGDLNQEMVVGETPNLAARLQGMAAPGEIVVADRTRRLASGLFEFEARGTHDLKGFSAPQPIYNVVSESEVESRFDARVQGRLNPIVGRETEMAKLEAQWRRACAGTGRVAFVRGQAGIGKSRLVRDFAARLEGCAHAELKLYCAPHLANRALHPFTREMRRTLDLDAAGGEPQRRLERLAESNPALDVRDLPALADLMGVARPSPAEDAQTRARRAVDLLLRRAEGLAADRPLLMIFEDAHWADPASLDVLDQLMKRIADLPLLLIVTFRTEFSMPWKGDEPGVVIDLDRLDAESGAKLIGNVVRNRVLPSMLVQQILEKADGVPLFVEELTKTVLDAMGGSGEGGADEPVFSVPATLQDSLMARLDLIDGGKEIAQMGAVVGREFTADMLSAIAPPDTQVPDGLERLCEAGLVFRGGHNGPDWYVFHHALVQDAAYGSMLKRTRREMHRAIAGAMLSGHPAFGTPEPDIVARHCTEAGMPAEAVVYWLKAGQDALDRASNLAALNHLRAAMAALEELPDDDKRASQELAIQMALAPASMAIHGWASQQVQDCCARARALAVDLGEHEHLFGATWGLWTNYFLRGEMDAALETAEAVDAMAGHAGDPLLATASDHAVGFSHYFRGDFALSLERARAGISRFDPEVEQQIVRMFQLSSTTTLHAQAAASLWMFGQDAAAEAELARSLALPQELEHAPSIAFSLAFTQYTLMYMEDWDRLPEVALRLERLSIDEGFRLWIPQARLFQGLCRALDGDLAGGLDRVRENFDAYARTGTTLTLVQLLPTFASLLVEANAAEEALARLDAMIADGGRRNEGALMPELYRVRGLARLHLGDAGGAVADTAEARGLARAQGATRLERRAERQILQIEPKSGLAFASNMSGTGEQ